MEEVLKRKQSHYEQRRSQWMRRWGGVILGEGVRGSLQGEVRGVEDGVYTKLRSPDRNCFLPSTYLLVIFSFIIIVLGHTTSVGE